MAEHIVMFSGGIGSWCTALRVRERFPHGSLYGLFADTKMEDWDLYRFLRAGASVIPDLKLVIVAEGRTPWEVFFDSRFLGNSRIDPCSRILKREFLRKWLETHCDPARTVVYLGIDWSEQHRFEKAKKYWDPWRVEAPMCEPPYLTKTQMIQQLRDHGVKPPRLYAMGFSHNNCGGFCIKAGQGHFKLLLEKMPERYAEHEKKEEELRAHIGKDVAILRDWRVKGYPPMTLRQLRERIERDAESVDMFDIGGCGCFSGNEDGPVGGDL